MEWEKPYYKDLWKAGIPFEDLLDSHRKVYVERKLFILIKMAGSWCAVKRNGTYIVIAFIFISVCVIGLGSNFDNGSREQFTDQTDNGISNSERYSGEEVNARIDEYAEQYQHSFTLASAEIEERLYGVWQARGYAGHTRSSRYQWDGLWGDVVIFCESAMIYGGAPYLNPVYACYESSAKDMEADAFLDLEWTDRHYEGLDGIVILAVGREKDGELAVGMPYRLILMGEHLMIERGGSYFVLEKVGMMELYDHLFMPATTEMDKDLYGVWQIKECVGIMEGSDTLGEGMVGDMIIFSENAWISDGIPSFEPVYIYSESCAGEVKTDRFFENVIWINGWDADWNGKVIAGIETEKNAKYGSGHRQQEPFKMIMTDDSLVIEKGGVYFKTQKVGEVEWYQSLLNVEPH